MMVGAREFFFFLSWKISIFCFLPFLSTMEIQYLLCSSTTSSSTTTLRIFTSLSSNAPPPSSSFASLPKSSSFLPKTYKHLPPQRFNLYPTKPLHFRHFSTPTPNFTIRAKDKLTNSSDSGGDASSSSSSSSSPNRSLVIGCSAATVVLAVANRVLYKLALVPMKEYPFFLAQITTFGYVVIYFSILYMRRRAGIVTDEMMKLPKFRFVIIGLLEALGVVSGMYAGAKLPGPAIPILSQTFLVWQLALSVVLLGRKYSWNRIVGCLLVAAGVIFAVTSGSDDDQMLSGLGFFWPVMMITSNAFQAGASILKELIFIDAATRLKGKLLDIFVVNSFGSGFQALFVLLFLPLLSNLKGIPFSQLPVFLKNGASCLFNVGGDASGCDGAPLLPLLYVAANIGFNISALNLVKISSAVLSSLVVMSSVPISIYVLSRSLPYLPEGASLSPFFLLGATILVAGLIIYSIPQPSKEDMDII